MTLSAHEPSAKYLMQMQPKAMGFDNPPCGWEVKPLGELSEFVTSGSRGWARYYSDIGATFVRSQNVLKGQLDFSDHQCVVAPVGSEGSRTRVELGDLLITITGNSVGNVAYVDRPLGEAYVSQHVGLVRLKDPSIAAYVCRFLSPGAPGNAQIVMSQSGQSKPGLNLTNLRDFVVAVPPEEEQCMIATALSDVDALIAGLERLIAKKRDIKQAAMQQLLTGQTRLPGFSGEWTPHPLGDLGTTYGGLVGKSKVDFGHGSARYVPFVNVMANTRIDCSALDRVHVASTENQNLVLPGDLLFNGSSETPEEVALCALMTETVENLYLNSFCFGFRLKQGADANGLFLTYVMRSQLGRELMKSLAQGSTRYNLSKSALLQASLTLPDLEEQTAIATVLSDMDADLAALEARLTKTRAIKQGMMQELLTGRTRLV